ncbi:transposase [Streptomyces sp. NPDC000405]|uniref:transposase n=1 Tax=Streptomyces sp. NPDC000405 TaxID=3161033 RepID=UPI00398D2C03
MSMRSVTEPHLYEGRTSWCQLLAAVHLGPDDDVAEVTARQVRRVVNDLTSQGQWEDGDPDILVVFDAGSTSRVWPTSLPACPSRCWDGCVRTVSCDGRHPHSRSMLCPYPQGGRPPKHGKEFRFAKPDTWGGPDTETVQVTDRYGTATTMAWDRPPPRLSPRLRSPEAWTGGRGS